MDVMTGLMIALEEAGDETITSLINTVLASDSHISLDDVIVKLHQLLSSGDILISEGRDSQTLIWVNLSYPASAKILEGLPDNIVFSDTNKRWLWDSKSPRPQVILSDSGFATARRLLSDE